jgi:hypothetical protein
MARKNRPVRARQSTPFPLPLQGYVNPKKSKFGSFLENKFADSPENSNLGKTRK